MKPSISEAEFAVLARRTGLTLSPEQVSSLYEAYGWMEDMGERLRTPRGREAEPALTFTTEIKA